MLLSSYHAYDAMLNVYATYTHVIYIHPKSEIFCDVCFFGIENFVLIKLILQHFVLMLEHAQPGKPEQTQYANTHAHICTWAEKVILKQLNPAACIPKRI